MVQTKPQENHTSHFIMPSRVMEVPIIVSHPKSEVVEFGQDAHLVCHAIGKGLSYKWYRNRERLTGETSNELRLYNLTLEDAGRYSCVVYNEKDSVLTWATIEIVTTGTKEI